MKVILREDVQNLGEMGAVIDVANGYGRNYLIPRELAVEASVKNIKEFEDQKQRILVKVKKIKVTAEGLAEKLSSMKLSIEAKAGEEDKLFGSVTTKDIAELIAKEGVEIDKRKIVLDETIKRLGAYEVAVKLPQNVTASVNLEVVKASPEEA